MVGVSEGVDLGIGDHWTGPDGLGLGSWALGVVLKEGGGGGWYGPRAIPGCPLRLPGTTPPPVPITHSLAPMATRGRLCP